MPKKQYGAADAYERKLNRVMERLSVESHNFNWDRWGCWVEFRFASRVICTVSTIAWTRPGLGAWNCR
ncbi:MAG: hypothetical protein ACYC0Q_15725 [Eubacteriales bacterium]